MSTSNQPQVSANKSGKGFGNSLYLKLLLIGFLGTILLIPDSMIRDMITERQYRQLEVEDELSAVWGGPQEITGPLLAIPYVIKSKDAKGKVHEWRHTAFFLPEEFHVKGNLQHEIRKRGIFQAVLYQSDLLLEGSFKKPDFGALHIQKPYKILWGQASLCIGISGTTGIKEIVRLNWSGLEFRMEPGNLEAFPGMSAVCTDVPLDSEKASYRFSIPLRLNGSRSLAIEPVGKETKVELSSDWPSPKFAGAFFPDQREISDSGFSATWQILDFNRSYPQQWLGREDFNSSALSVELIRPIDEYAKNDRATKYAILVIGLTFLLYFFFEILKKIRIHPFQYLLVGLAIVIFYLLLLSLSEQVGFNFAYFIAALATIVLITGYSKAILKKWAPSLQLFLLLSFVYGFIFVLLQLEDLALLVGSIGVFAVLAVVMYASRKIDWYKVGAQRPSESL